MNEWIHGKSILVTGAVRRIGRAIALDLASHGASIAVHVFGSTDAGERTAAECRAFGVDATVVVADQADVEAVHRACTDATHALGRIDGLINSAAIWPKVAFGSVTQADFDHAIHVNLRGPFFFAQALSKHMQERGDGAIINLADVSTDRPIVDAIPYTLAKSGLVTLTYSLAKALAPHIRVNCVSPGPIAFPVDYKPYEAERDINATLMGRAGHPRDVVEAVRYALNAPYVTGTVLPVDGGFRFGI